MKILITGGAGFIGSHFVANYQGRANVVVFDNLLTGNLDNLKGLSYELVHASVCDYQALESALTNANVVYHFAGLTSVCESFDYPLEYYKINVKGTEKVLKAAHKNKVKKIIFASSAAVYSESDIKPQREDSPLAANSPYGFSKVKAESVCHQFNMKHGLSIAVMRIFNVYGDRLQAHKKSSSVIPVFISHAVQNKDLFVHGNGQQTRDFISIRDLVSGVSKLTESLIGFNIYNIGTGVETQIVNLANMIVKLTDSNSKIYIDENQNLTRNISRSVARLDKISAHGWMPKVPLHDGLLCIIDN